MSDLSDYIVAHVERGTCMCGRCLDASPKPEPEQQQPNEHTANLEFFEVKAIDDPNKDKLIKLIKDHQAVFTDSIDLFDGKEHNYMELGGWIGDQGVALMLMGLGHLLDLWNLLTPSSMLGDTIPDNLKQQMAEGGMVSIQADAPSSCLTCLGSGEKCTLLSEPHYSNSSCDMQPCPDCKSKDAQAAA